MMRSRDDLRYFREGAEQEIERAEMARHPGAARAHALLAGYYLDLVHHTFEARADGARRAAILTIGSVDRRSETRGSRLA